MELIIGGGESSGCVTHGHHQYNLSYNLLSYKKLKEKKSNCGKIKLKQKIKLNQIGEREYTLRSGISTAALRRLASLVR